MARVKIIDAASAAKLSMTSFIFAVRVAGLAGIHPYLIVGGNRGKPLRGLIQDPRLERLIGACRDQNSQE
jgi:hypothetical protein